jgi:hypothetical protein
MCDICGNPRCGEYSTLSAGAKPVTDAVQALKAIGFAAVGVTASDRVVTGAPTMAHDAMTAREILDKREGDKARLAKAHEAQHGTATANENLNLPDEDEAGAPKAKAQQPADDKAQAAPKARE